jgi:hypothetical protein
VTEGELDLRDDRNAASRRFPKDRDRLRDTGREDDLRRTLEQGVRMRPEDLFHPPVEMGQTRKRRLVSDIGQHDLLALTDEKVRGGNSRPRGAEYDDLTQVSLPPSSPARQRSFNVDRLNMAKITAMIQKRTTTFVSLHPDSSKW